MSHAMTLDMLPEQRRPLLRQPFVTLVAESPAGLFRVHFALAMTSPVRATKTWLTNHSLTGISRISRASMTALTALRVATSFSTDRSDADSVSRPSFLQTKF